MQFIKVQIYCQKRCCFADIENSNKPVITINVKHIESLSETRCWNITGGERYPYRILTLSSGIGYLIPEEMGKSLDRILNAS